LAARRCLCPLEPREAAMISSPDGYCGVGRQSAARPVVGRLLAALVILGAGLAWASVTDASAATPAWKLSAESSPTNLPPGGEGVVSIVASNIGDAVADGSTTAVVITSELPPGVAVTGIGATSVNEVPVQCSNSVNLITCSYSGHVNPYER